MSFMDIINGISQLATAPVFLTMNFSTIFFDQFGITLNHTADLFALVWMDQKHYFVVTHRCSLRVVVCHDMRSDKELIELTQPTDVMPVGAMQARHSKQAHPAKQGQSKVFLYLLSDAAMAGLLNAGVVLQISTRRWPPKH